MLLLCGMDGLAYSKRAFTSWWQHIMSDGERVEPHFANKRWKWNLNIIYKIPCTCGRVNVGQSGRCVNVWLRDHDLSLHSSSSGHLTVHVRESKCTPLFNQRKVLSRLRSKRAREMFEAKTIIERGDTYISTPEISLSEKEKGYLNLFS